MGCQGRLAYRTWEPMRNNNILFKVRFLLKTTFYHNYDRKNLFRTIFVVIILQTINSTGMLRLAILSLLFAATVTIYDFKVPGLDGKSIDLSKYKGKKIMIVNTASKCGFTPQYADLQKLYDTYKDKLVIVG